MARLYADEDFGYPTVEELRRLGHDVLTAQEAGEGDQARTDDEVLAFAIVQGRAVITFNRRHFIRLQHSADSHFGIIVCSRDNDHVALAGRVDRSLTEFPSLENRLLRVNRPP